MDKMKDWLEFFHKMNNNQKIEIHFEKDSIYENTLGQVTFEDLEVLSEYYLEEIYAKDDKIVIVVENINLD